MKKIVSMLLVLVMLLGLTACANQQTQQPAAQNTQSDTTKTETPKTDADAVQTEEPEQTVTISYLSRYTNPEVPRHKFFLDKLEEFRALYPNIIVEDVSIAEADSYKSTLRASVAAGTAPTLFICSDAFPHLEWASNGVMSDLTPILESSDWEGPTDPAVFESFSFANEGLDGVYGVPNGVVNSPVYVNTKLLKQYNLETPQTWEEVVAMAEVLKAADPEIIPFSVSAKTTSDLGRFFSEFVVRMYGLEFRDKFIVHEVKWTDPEMIQALEKFKELIDMGIFGPDAVSFDTDSNVAKFGEGKVAMLFTATWFWDRFNGFDFADEIDCVNFPYFENAPENKDIWFATTSEGFCISAPVGSPEYEAAGKLLNFMLSKSTFEQYASEIAEGGIYPLEIDFDLSAASHPMGTFMEGYATRSATTDIIGTYMNNSGVLNITNTELQTLFVGQDVQTVAENLQAQYDELFQ